MRTALILTGGSGTRMEPITKTLNKGLIPIDGQPAIERIILQLERSKIDRILVLSGQLSWQVEFFIHSRFKSSNSEIIISATPIEYTPAERLLHASRNWIDSSEIILIYCDNIFEDSIISKHLSGISNQRVLVQKRAPGNIEILDSGKVSYSVIREEKSGFVELGYWLLNTMSFFTFLNEERDLPKALDRLTHVEVVYPEVIGSYRSLSDLARFTNERAEKRKTLFLDRDGILIKSIGKGAYVRSVNEVLPLEANVNFLSELSSNYNVDFVVVTNQAGVERKLITIEQVNQINSFIAIEMLNKGVPILAFYVCPHHWDSKCNCRKPRPGMIESAIRDFKLNPLECLLIGDRDSDIGAGLNAGIKSFLITEDMTSMERAEAYEEVVKSLEVSCSN